MTEPTKYLVHIDAKPDSFRRLDSTMIETIKGMIDRGPGIRTIMENGKKAVVLRSTSTKDILDAVQYGKWSHTRNPSDIVEGTTVYVIPDQEQEKLYGREFSFGVKFTAARAPYRDEEPDAKWSSEMS